jgi:hypothetical protein
MLREELSVQSAELCKTFLDTISNPDRVEHTIARSTETVLRHFNDAHLNACKRRVLPCNVFGPSTISPSG